jgi:uncharacterized XkdX family phage protein
MTAFEKWKDRYDKYWCTKEQLKRLVQLEVLTMEEYKEITGEDYVA